MYHQARNKLQIPFRFLEPTFYSGLLDDPLLVLRNRPEGNNILVDCGQIHHLAKRVLKAVDVILISHAHMDHFMGMANFARNILVSTRTVQIYGPPGISTRLESLLAGFDWNLCENFWCSFMVHEIDYDQTRSYLLPGPDGFRRNEQPCTRRSDDLVFSNNQCRIRAAICDHKIPSMIYRIDERPAFAIDEKKLVGAGLVRGDWLRELNSRYNRGLLGDRPIRVLKSVSGEATEVEIAHDGELYAAICAEQKPISIGYLTDVGWDQSNRKVISALFSGVTMLICECTYAAEDIDKARASFHLCTRDVNEIMADIRPEFVLPLHLSKSYIGDTERILSELEPPDTTTLLRLPDHIAPRPLLPDEIPAPQIG